MGNIYIVYEIDFWPYTVGKDYVLENSLFGSVKLIKILIMISKYSGYGLDSMHVEVFLYHMVGCITKPDRPPTTNTNRPPTTNNRPPTVYLTTHRPPTHQQVFNRPTYHRPPTHLQVFHQPTNTWSTDKSSTNPPITDNRLKKAREIFQNSSSPNTFNYYI